MKSREERWDRILLLLAMGLSVFVLGCTVKQITTEVREDGSGRNIFILALAKSDDTTQDTTDQEDSLEQLKTNAEACGATALPWADDQYRGHQVIFGFQSLSEVPGQIACLLGDTTQLRIEGQYEETSLKKVYHLQVHLVPAVLWAAEDNPMLYRVIMPGRIVSYTDLTTSDVRTVKDSGNQVSWYFTSHVQEEEGESVPEYTLTVQAEKSMVSATDWLAYGGIFLLVAVMVTAVGVLTRKGLGAASRPHPAPTRYPPAGTHFARQGRTGSPAQPSRSSSSSGTIAPYPAVGSVVDRYKIREELGRGGMAAVFLARHEALQRDVALKILAPQLTATPDFVERFRTEGRILAHLSHPHIVTVYDAGCAQGYYYLAMELVRGLSLDRALKRWGRLEPYRAIAIAQQVAQALDYAHQRGIIHRDVKPANILLDGEGRVQVADFGIVAILGEKQIAHTRIGTPRYMAYEQFNGAATPQSDLYSLGACLYEMLTGECPPAFGLQAPTPPSYFNRAVSPSLDHAVLKSLRSDPRRRYATMRDLMAAMRQVG